MDVNILCSPAHSPTATESHIASLQVDLERRHLRVNMIPNGAVKVQLDDVSTQNLCA